MNEERQVSETIFYCCVGVLLVAFGCGVPPTARQPVTAEAQLRTELQQTNEPVRGNDSMPTGIFDNDPEAAEAWQRFTADDRYRVALTEDFSIPEAAMESKEQRYDIERAIKFAYVGEDINRDGLYRDRAFIVVDTTLSGSAKFGLVIFNELEDKKSLPEPHWVYREKDLSRTVMSWASSGLILVDYHNDGTYDLCRIKWDKRRQRYSCK